MSPLFQRAVRMIASVCRDSLTRSSRRCVLLGEDGQSDHRLLNPLELVVDQRSRVVGIETELVQHAENRPPLAR